MIVTFKLAYIAIMFFLLMQFAHLVGEMNQDQPTMKEVCQQFVCTLEK